MGKNVVIKVENVSKKYCKYLNRSMAYGLIDIGKNLLGLPAHTEKLRKGEFWALNDVSLEIEKGEILGIIGPNGSGKTTLLKLLNGIFWPDKGKITIRGRVGGLIEIGAGFHPLLNGRENIYVNGAILGMRKKEIEHKFNSIIEFAEIGDFIDTPVKYYSSGMFVKLGFAVAVHCEPDILLVDEVLAVGDAKFWSKSIKKLKELNELGMTIFVVTHNMWVVQTFCTRAICIYKGNIIAEGNPLKTICAYKDVMETAPNNKESIIQNIEGEAQIIDFEVLQEGNWALDREAYPDSGVKVKIKAKVKRFPKITFLIRATSQDGNPYFTVYSKEVEVPVNGKVECECTISHLMLLPGEYLIWGAICSPKGEREILAAEKYSIFIKNVGRKSCKYGLFWNTGSWRIKERED